MNDQEFNYDDEQEDEEEVNGFFLFLGAPHVIHRESVIIVFNEKKYGLMTLMLTNPFWKDIGSPDEAILRVKANIDSNNFVNNKPPPKGPPELDDPIMCGLVTGNKRQNEITALWKKDGEFYLDSLNIYDKSFIASETGEIITEKNCEIMFTFPSVILPMQPTGMYWKLLDSISRQEKATIIWNINNGKIIESPVEGENLETMSGNDLLVMALKEEYDEESIDFILNEDMKVFAIIGDGGQLVYKKEMTRHDN